MKRQILLFGIIALVFVSCKSNVEKAEEIIKAELFKTLYDFASYEPIETIVDSAFSSVYRDSTILSYAFTIQAYYDLYKEEFAEAQDGLSSLETWVGSYSSYGISKVNAAKEQFETHIAKAQYYLSKADSTRSLLKEELDRFNPAFCGYQAKHKFRCKTKGGNFTIENYIYIIDEKFKKVLSVSNPEDEDEIKIRDIIDEAKEYEKETV